MVRVTVMYEQSEGTSFNEDYFINNHIPLVKNRLQPMGMKSIAVDRGIAGGGGDPAPFIYMAHMLFDSIEQFKEAFVSAREELAGDVPKYTDIKPKIQISEIIAE